MTLDSVLHLFDKLNIWSRDGQRAPHKPLLILYALGRWSRGETADVPFKEVDGDLTVPPSQPRRVLAGMPVLRASSARDRPAASRNVRRRWPKLMADPPVM